MERHQFDENEPHGKMSLANLRGSLRGLHQLDMMPLRPRAKYIIDDMEYSTDAAIQAEWSGTGVTVTAESTTVQEGNYSQKLVIDGTNNRTLTRTQALDLSPFASIMIWERSSGTSDTLQLWVQDSGGDESRWDITTNASAGTWQQDTLTLSTPDSNNGADADLSDITSWGLRNLTSSTTYYIDTIKAVVAMTVAVEGTESGSFYKNVYLGKQPLSVSAQTSPTITAPSTNPRIDILTINSSGTLAWVTGTEASSPTVPWTSLGQSVMPICLVYQKTTMTKVLDYEDKDTDTNQGYIYSDLRPFLNTGFTWQKGSDVASGTSIALGDGNFFDITGTTTIQTITAKDAGTIVTLQFDGALTVSDGAGNLKLNGDYTTTAESTLMLVSDGTNWFEVARNVSVSSFVGLSDTPASLSGQGLKVVRVNTGGTALEFRTLVFADLNDAPSYSGNALKFLRANSGATALEFATAAQYQLFTANGSWTAPAGVTECFVTLLGGGGGGGGGVAGTSGGGSGGAGGDAIIRHRMTVTPTNSYTITVGSGAAGHAAGTGTAGSGGDSTFVGDTANSNYTLTAQGGPGGKCTGDTVDAGGTGYTAGSMDGSGTSAGGVASTGSGSGAANPSASNSGGGGGASHFGKGGAAGAGTSQPGSDAGHGGGGGGAGRSAAGGDGGDGFVLVEYYV